MRCNATFDSCQRLPGKRWQPIWPENFLQLEHMPRAQPADVVRDFAARRAHLIELGDFAHDGFGFGGLGVGDVDGVAVRRVDVVEFVGQHRGRQVARQAGQVAFAVGEGGFDDQRGHGQLVEALPAVHSIPAVGYAVRGPEPGAPWWAFTGDTERNPALWQRINQLDVHSLFIETAFSNRESELAQLSRHLSPHTLAQELAHIAPGRRYPIYITHTKPSETSVILSEITQLRAAMQRPDRPAPELRLLHAGDVFDIF